MIFAIMLTALLVGALLSLVGQVVDSMIIVGIAMLLLIAAAIAGVVCLLIAIWSEVLS